MLGEFKNQCSLTGAAPKNAQRAKGNFTNLSLQMKVKHMFGVAAGLAIMIGSAGASESLPIADQTKWFPLKGIDSLYGRAFVRRPQAGSPTPTMVIAGRNSLTGGWFVIDGSTINYPDRWPDTASVRREVAKAEAELTAAKKAEKASLQGQAQGQAVNLPAPPNGGGGSFGPMLRTGVITTTSNYTWKTSSPCNGNSGKRVITTTPCPYQNAGCASKKPTTQACRPAPTPNAMSSSKVSRNTIPTRSGFSRAGTGGGIVRIKR